MLITILVGGTAIGAIIRVQRYYKKRTDKAAAKAREETSLRVAAEERVRTLEAEKRVAEEGKRVAEEARLAAEQTVEEQKVEIERLTQIHTTLIEDLAKKGINVTYFDHATSPI